MRAVALKGKREFELKEIEEPVIDNENVVIKVLKKLTNIILTIIIIVEIALIILFIGPNLFRI